jgi:hypothetical protein
MLTVDQFSALQHYLVEAYAPFIAWFFVGLMFAGMAVAVLILFLVITRELFAAVRVA